MPEAALAPALPRSPDGAPPPAHTGDRRAGQRRRMALQASRKVYRVAHPFPGAPAPGHVARGNVDGVHLPRQSSGEKASPHYARYVAPGAEEAHMQPELVLTDMEALACGRGREGLKP